jgi:hypothetical protein
MRRSMIAFFVACLMDLCNIPAFATTCSDYVGKKPIVYVKVWDLCTDVPPKPIPGRELDKAFKSQKPPKTVDDGKQCLQELVYGYRDAKDVQAAINMLNRVFADFCFELEKFQTLHDDGTLNWEEWGANDKRVRTASENQVDKWTKLRVFIVANPYYQDPPRVIHRLNGYSSGGALGLCNSQQPWNCKFEWDGVTVGADRLTTITFAHEVGHWLGLYHTFQPDCSTDPRVKGDRVDDTAGEPEGQGKDEQNGVFGGDSAECPSVLKLATCTSTDRRPIVGRADAPAPVNNIMEYNLCRGEYVTPKQYSRIVKRFQKRQNLSTSEDFKPDDD